MKVTIDIMSRNPASIVVFKGGAGVTEVGMSEEAGGAGEAGAEDSDDSDAGVVVAGAELKRAAILVLRRSSESRERNKGSAVIGKV